ncbi:MAG TPA: hypothetical protein VK045_04115 [Ornithinicoccus sp.]|nr:hypothetical protein [Ornithinicoccus sp.]
MARIRTIKPDVWSDPDFVACSPLARLLWIGTWNHADDYGVLKDEPERLKLQILPNDPCDPHALVDELVARRRLVRKVAPDGTKVLVIRTFTVHQKIDKRAVGRWGHPDQFTDPQDPTDPPGNRRPATDPHQSQPIPTDPNHTNGTERNGTENNKDVELTSPPDLRLVEEPVSPPATVPDQVRQVFAEWQEVTGHKRALLDEGRKSKIRKALKQYPLEDVLDAVRGWRHSPFHRGENDRGTVYDEIKLILRDAERIERFRDLERNPASRPGRKQKAVGETSASFPEATW